MPAQGAHRNSPRGGAHLRRAESVRVIQQALREGLADAMLVTHLPHVRYLTGFTGSNAWLLLRKRSAVFLTDPRYREQSVREVRNAQILIVSGSSMTEALRREGLLRRLRSMAFEAGHCTYTVAQNLESALKPLHLVPLHDAVEQLRENKYPDEIHATRQAIAISEAVFADVLPFLRPGVSEIDIAAEITYRQRRLGADEDSFAPIVLFGKRSSLVHGQPSRTALRPGQAVLMDFGCRVQGYASDITRTVFCGKAPPRLRRVYDVVQKAQEKGRALAGPGIAANVLDDAVRSVIRDNGYGDRFEHGLGHGLGLEVHERPLLSWRNSAELEPGMIITIEPGIYIPGLGGVRIEDDVLITSRGADLLSTLPRDLLELDA
ncbi:MAG: aminopeptidase P family protein [Bacteroidota bacterium]|nr:aminopeptidase P family protein [Bacteroidota bacterium]